MNEHGAPGAKLTCRDFLDLVLEYVEEDMNADVRVLCERHLELCRACRDYLASYRMTQRLGREALQEELPSVPEDLLRTILDAAGAGPQPN